MKVMKCKHCGKFSVYWVMGLFGMYTLCIECDKEDCQED